MVSDPGRHSYKEWLVTILWLWQIQKAMHCPAMYLKPGTGTVDPTDVDLEDDLQRFAARKKMDRVPAFRQLQGYSKQFSVLTNGRVDLSFFQLGDNYEVRPVRQNERRATIVGATQDESFIIASPLLGI